MRCTGLLYFVVGLGIGWVIAKVYIFFAERRSTRKRYLP